MAVRAIPASGQGVERVKLVIVNTAGELPLLTEIIGDRHSFYEPGVTLLLLYEETGHP